jgi:hypothetical protein
MKKPYQPAAVKIWQLALEDVLSTSDISDSLNFSVDWFSGDLE